MDLKLNVGVASESYIGIPYKSNRGRKNSGDDIGIRTVRRQDEIHHRKEEAWTG